MTFTIRKAERDRVPLFVGLVAPSGAGKTLSALRIAAGIQSVVGGTIVGIDTEARRMLHYASEFDFQHMEFKPPFSSARYAEAIKAAVDSGAKTVIIDSMSHEHEGEGGYLEYHEAELDRMAGDDWKKRERVTFTAWIKPSRERRRLVNSLLQQELNVIACFRAKEKLKIVKGREPEPLGWQAIAGEEFVFEMAARCLLTPGSNGTPDWSDEAFALGVPKISRGLEKIFRHPDHEQLDEWVGRQLARWAGGARQPKAEPQQDEALPADGAMAPPMPPLVERTDPLVSAGIKMTLDDVAAAIRRGAFDEADDIARDLGAQRGAAEGMIKSARAAQKGGGQ